MKSWPLQSVDPAFFVQTHPASRPATSSAGAPFTVRSSTLAL